MNHSGKGFCDQESCSTTGIYFSANDAVLPWVYPFLVSLRQSNPTLPIQWIPFDDNSPGIESVLTDFGIEKWIDPDGFTALETLGRSFELGHTLHSHFWFRRYAVWWGPFERFVYLDVRQLILSSLDPYLTGLDQGFDFVGYDCDVHQVYEPGPLRAEFLGKGGGRGFNSGRWASTKGLFSLVDLERLGEEALTKRDQLNPRNTDQGFLNYCLDRKEVQCGQVAEVDGTLIHSGWAGQRGHPYQDDQGEWRWWDHGGLEHGKRVMLLHWAGRPWGLFSPHFPLLLRFTSWCRVKKLGWRMLWGVARPLERLYRARFFNQVLRKLRSRGRPQKR